MVTASHVGLCTLLFLVLGTHGAGVTPMEKVITLLKDLSAKVQKEGAKEAAQYDKFACFCKEQADGKLYSIEKSDSKIDSLKAEIKELDTSIALLNSDVGDLSKKISGLAASIKSKTEKRDQEHKEYLVKAKDMNEAIEACGAAIDALKNSKKSMKGAKLNFAQVQKATGGLLNVISLGQLAMAPGALALLSELAGTGKAAPKFEYQSNEIIATIEGLQATFKNMKKNLDMEEFNTNSAFESEKLGLFNEKQFAEKEKNEKETLAEGKTEQVNEARSDKDAETKDRDADQTFMDQLTSDCETKAQLFDQRSKTRAQEITAIADATEQLQKGAVPNYSANKKIVGAQMKAVVKKAAIQPVSFLQVVNDVHKKDSGKQVVLQHILSLLNGKAGKLGSATLASAALRVQMAEDHFVKVRALIKDLIEKLKSDAKAEATQKGFCDKSMAKAVSDRDQANGKIEMASAQITTLTAKKNSLQEDISTLQKDIAGLQKELLEATELRANEKADNKKTIEMSAEAIAAVEQAHSILKGFYGKALLETGKYTPPKADREGNTVGDLAPEVFSGEYHGSGSESKGIIGILEVILSDFERTKKRTASDEQEGEKAFEDLEKQAKADIKQKQADVKQKEGEVSDAHSDLLDQQQALSDAKDLLGSATGSLEDLKAMCVKGEETWEERKQKREDEIAALKDAMEILDNWQN